MLKNPIYCAIDTHDLAEASQLATSIAPYVGGVKLGLQFFCNHGRAGVEKIAAEAGVPIFLDLKFHDIPNTVNKAVEALAGLPIAMTTLHASGGPEMLKRAAQGADFIAQKTGKKPLVIAVTVLTSLDASDLAAVGQPTDTMAQAVRLAELTQASGVDGVVCSPHEIEAIRHATGPDFHLCVPGIRMSDAQADDQKRTLTPADALARGASSLVIGRPITSSPNPAEAAAAIAASIR
jgi:orotidine-5'-phosphate decarboxylase